MPFDIGIGLIIGVWLDSQTDIGLIWSLSIGVGATLLPDADFILKYVRTGRIPTSEHRDLLHYPLLLTPAVGLLGALVNPFVGLALATGVLAHFIHDSIGIGFGIKWLYPFKKNSYLFLFQIKTPTNAAMPKQRLYSWTDKQRDEMIRNYAYKDWIRYVYFRPNLWGAFEYLVFGTGVVAVLANT